MRGLFYLPSQTPWPRFGKKWSRLREKFVDDTRKKKKKKKKNRIYVDYIYSYHGYYFPRRGGGNVTWATWRIPLRFSSFSITMFKTRPFLPPVTHTLSPKIGKKLS